MIQNLRYLLLLGLLATSVATAQVPAPETAEDQQKRKADEALQFADGYYKRAMYDRAARSYAAVVRNFPDHKDAPAAWFQWAQSLLQNKDEDGALDVYVRLAKHHNKHQYGAQASLVAAGMLANRNRIAEAETMLANVDPGKLDEAKREAHTYYLALARHYVGKPDAAEAVFAKLAALSASPERQFRSHAKFHLARVARSKSKDDEALVLFSELAKSKAVPAEMKRAAASQVGDILFVSGDYPKAAAAYRNFLTLGPSAKEAISARVSLAWCLAQEDKHREIVELLRAEDAATMGPDALYLLGHAHWKLRAYDAATSSFERLLAAYADYRLANQARLLIIECNSELRNFDKVILLSNEFTKKNPQDSRTPDVLFYLASAYMDKGDKQKAAEAFEDALKRFWGKWSYQNEAVIRLARLYEEMAAAGFPDSPEAEAKNKISSLYKKAAESYRRFDGAASPARHLDAILRAADCEIKADDTTRAFADFQFVADTWPTEPGAVIALLAMAQIAESKGSSEEVIRITDVFMKNHAKHKLAGQAQYLRGVSYYRTNNLPKATIDFRAAVDAPKFEQQELAHLFLAYCLWGDNKRDQALRVFEKLLDRETLQGNFTPELLVEIGDQYIRANNFNAAASCFQILAKHENPDYRAAGEIGRARTELARKNTEAAIRVLVVTIKRLQKDEYNIHLPIAKTYLGEAYRQRGSYDQARLELEEAIALGTGDPRAGAISRLGMAQVLYHEAMLPTKDGKEPVPTLLDKALDHAYCAFIVKNDPEASPQAILLVMRIHETAGRDKDVLKFGNELRKRYPLAFEAMRKRPENTTIFRHF